METSLRCLRSSTRASLGTFPGVVRYQATIPATIRSEASFNARWSFPAACLAVPKPSVDDNAGATDPVAGQCRPSLARLHLAQAARSPEAAGHQRWKIGRVVFAYRQLRCLKELL